MVVSMAPAPVLKAGAQRARPGLPHEVSVWSGTAQTKRGQDEGLTGG